MLSFCVCKIRDLLVVILMDFPVDGGYDFLVLGLGDRFMVDGRQDSFVDGSVIMTLPCPSQLLAVEANGGCVDEWECT